MTNLLDGLKRRRYVVSSIEKSDPPSSDCEGEWYKYVIAGGSSGITGVRSGTYQSVAQYAEEFADHINERSVLGFSGYPPLKLSAGTNKKAQV